MVMSLNLLNLAGGDCVDDLKILEADEGFCQILRKSKMHGLRRKVRRALERRWRKEKKRTVPSPSAVFRYLSKFHNAEQEKIRIQSNTKAFIPAANELCHSKMCPNTGILPNDNYWRKNPLYPAWKIHNSHSPFPQCKWWKKDIRCLVL